ncbi:MAG TPA: PAS domain-containing protein [Flavisolibacter sp.]|nr:PAS domain-containing protein [Flavisolibacter sp.]
MEVFEAYDGMYCYQHLPGFAKFILDHHLTEFVQEQLELGFRFNIPLLKNLLQRFSKEDLIEISKKTSAEYLSYLKDNRAYDQIKDASEKWMKDQLDVIGKFQITGPDITLVNFLRQQAFKKLILFYVKDLPVALELNKEIDTLILGANTTAIDIYVDILKDKIEDESLLSDKLIAASPAITFLFDIVHNKEIFVSGKVNEVMGYTPEELVEMGSDVLLQLTHPDDLAMVARSIEELVTGNNEKVGQIEYRFLHKSGSYRWLRTYYVIFKRDEFGSPVELLGKTFEITSEKETALALEKREQQLLEAQALAHVGSYEWNIQENYSSNSPEVYKIFDMNNGQHYEEFMSHVHPDDIQKVKDAIAESFESGNYDCEYRYLKNGTEKVIWSLGKVEFNNGKAVRMVGTVQDITEIKAIEKELLERTRQLEESNKSLKQFASIASHDLKEPLRKISMFADVVMEAEKDKLSQSSMDKLMRMQLSSKSMMQMIQDILSFSMLEVKQPKEKVSLDNLIKEILDLLDERIHEKRAQIICDPLPDAYVIPSQFRQMLQNLISNALKFSKNHVPPKIEIHYKWEAMAGNLKAASKYLQLNICDNGIGIDEEYLNSIFDLFKRLHPRAEYEGSGLGLAITRRVIDNHEGQITVTSQPGKGTCFFITIPQ